MNEKGFILIDSLVSVLIVTGLAVIVSSCFMVFEKYHSLINEFSEQENSRLAQLFESGGECSCRMSDESS